jgi:hypothetical protein
MRKNLTLELDYKKLILENKYAIHKEINQRMNNKFLEKIYIQESGLIEKNKEIEMMKNIIRKSGINSVNTTNNSLIVNNYNNVSDITYHTFSIQDGNVLNFDENEPNRLNYETLSNVNTILNPPDSLNEKNGADLLSLQNGCDFMEKINFKIKNNNNIDDDITNLDSNKGLINLKNTASSPIKEIPIYIVKPQNQNEFNGTIQILNKTFSKIVDDLIDDKLEVKKVIKEIEKEKSPIVDNTNKINDKKKTSNVNKFLNSSGKKKSTTCINSSKNSTSQLNKKDNIKMRSLSNTPTNNTRTSEKLIKQKDYSRKLVSANNESK